MVCRRANSQITWKCRDAVASSHPTYPSSKSSTLKCSQTVAMCPIPRLMALKLICFVRPCESPSNVESISRKSYYSLFSPVTFGKIGNFPFSSNDLRSIFFQVLSTFPVMVVSLRCKTCDHFSTKQGYFFKVSGTLDLVTGENRAADYSSIELMAGGGNANSGHPGCTSFAVGKPPSNLGIPSGSRGQRHCNNRF